MKIAEVTNNSAKPLQPRNSMFGFVRNLFFSKKLTEEISPECMEKNEIFRYLNEAKKEMDIASKNFELVKDEALIDYYVYQLKAAETKYQYLLKIAKERNYNYKDIDIVGMAGEGKSISKYT